jgi:hypothetical protein
LIKPRKAIRETVSQRSPKRKIIVLRTNSNGEKREKSPRSTIRSDFDTDADISWVVVFVKTCDWVLPPMGRSL